MTDEARVKKCFRVLLCLTVMAVFAFVPAGLGGNREGRNKAPAKDGQAPGELVISSDGLRGKKAAVKGNDREELPLKGKIICIDPGHQAEGDASKEPLSPFAGEMKEKVTRGTIGVITGIPECEFNLEVSLMLKDELEKLGASVVMTRLSNHVNISNMERSLIANESGAEIFVRVHADSSADESVKGISVLYPGGKYIKDRGLLQRSKIAAECVLKALLKATEASRGRLVERDDLTGFNWSEVPAILVEAGFMSNPEEDLLLADEDYRRKLAEGMAEGIMEYFKKVE